ncbi:hypothetical protein M1413_03230 [Patescibacteria group bacterium]|nr:hypothetical protein [Patescibacteria group bacterium]MCL5114205.1 hypothetical protein [Patescibacteria group bacterium]
MAIQYLQHEFRKILNGIRDPKTWRLIDREIANFPKTQGGASFWNLVAAISEDWKLKSVFRILSDTRVTWTLQEISLKRIVLTGMSPEIDRYTIARCDGSPKQFLKLWEGNRKARSDILKTGFSKHGERDYYPIFLWEGPDGLHVFDGMRRMLLAIINRKKTIRAWVGKPSRKKGGPLIANGFAYALSAVYRHAGKRNNALDNAIIEIVKTIKRDYRNGKEVTEKRIAGWSRDEKIKKIFGQK